MLYRVIALSSTSAWAVGSSAIATIAGPVTHPLVEHWNGLSWQVVSSQSVGTYMPNGELFDIAAISPTNMYAVGDYVTDFGLQQSLIEHYDGRSWTAVASPNVGVLGNALSGITAVRGTQTVWAVGFYQDGSGTYKTLIERSSGLGWSVVASPNVGTSYNELFGVASVSLNNVVAVGTFYLGTATVPVTARTLAERFDGTTWSVVATPNYDTQYGQDHNILFDVTLVPGTATLWAAGTATLDVPSTLGGAMLDQTLTEFFDGSRWNLVPSADPYVYNAGLYTITAVSPTSVWAVGIYMSATGWDATLAEHYDGRQWTIVSTTDVGSLNSRLFGVAVVSGCAWAVGQYTTGNFSLPGISQNLIERACGV
jgi:hypothetical protein